jgi:hypothetical protein
METANDAEWLLSEDKTKLSFSLEVSSGGKTVRYEDEFPVTLPNRLRIINADRLVLLDDPPAAFGCVPSWETPRSLLGFLP